MVAGAVFICNNIDRKRRKYKGMEYHFLWEDWYPWSFGCGNIGTHGKVQDLVYLVSLDLILIQEGELNIVYMHYACNSNSKNLNEKKIYK